ncbi:MAG: hypothetical protein ACXWO1_15630 [Isosphaeraceae bacterium]
MSFMILAGQAALLCERIAAGETRTADRPGLRAGAQAIDVSPRTFPVLINFAPPESNSSIATTGKTPVALGFLFELADHHRMNVQARYDDRRPFWNELRLQLDSLGLEMDALKSIAP